MQCVFIDESGDDNYFVLAAIIVSNESFLDKTISKTRKKFKNIVKNLSELHENKLQKKHPYIKNFIFNDILDINSDSTNVRIGAVFSKINSNLIKDEVYKKLVFHLIKKTISKYGDCNKIVLDNYNNRKF